MGTAITLPSQYRDSIVAIQKDIIACTAIGNMSKIFEANYVNNTLININEQEQFIRDQFLAQGNYVLDISGVTQLRFTGCYLLGFSHMLVYLVNAKVIPMSRLKQFHVDMEPYLISEGKKDGNCLILLPFVAKLISETRSDTSVGWKKFQEISDYMKSIDPNTLEWLAGADWSQPNDTDIPKTVENIRNASIFFYNSFINFTAMYFNEIYNVDQEDNIEKILIEWSETQIKADLNTTIYPMYASYFQQYMPSSISFFEHAISSIWTSKTIEPLKKIEVIYKTLRGIDAFKHYCYGAFHDTNIAVFDQAKGREVIDKVEGWLPDLFFKQLAIESNATNIANMLEEFKELKIYDKFIIDIKGYISNMESIVSIYGEEFQHVYKNILKINDDQVTVIFANAVAKCNLSAMANEIIATVNDQSNVIKHEENHKDVTLVLTKTAVKNVSMPIIIVHNQKSGTTIINIDRMNGVSQTKKAVINDFFSVTEITFDSASVLRTGFDTTLITVE